MIPVWFGIGTATLVAIVHALIVRRFPRGFQLISIPIFSLVAFLVIAIGISNSNLSFSADQWLMSVLLTSSLSIAYTLAFIGIVYDSPTLALIHAIDDYGQHGMPISALPTFIDRHPFVNSRLAALIAAGVLAEEGDTIIYRGKVGPLVRLSDLYRRLCGRETTTG